MNPDKTAIFAMNFLKVTHPVTTFIGEYVKVEKSVALLWTLW